MIRTCTVAATTPSIAMYVDPVARSRVRISPGAWRCVLEQDTSASLLSTGSTQENVPI